MRFSWSGLLTLGIIGYPIVIHSSIQLSLPWLALAYIMLLLTGVTLYQIVLKRWRIVSVLVIIEAVSGMSIWQFGVVWVKFLPPVFIFAMLAWLFGRTLFANRTPIITVIAEEMHEAGVLCDIQRKYTNTVSYIWTGFFILMLIEVILLAMFASEEIWSLMTNFYNYIILLAIFFIEYTVRKLLVKQDRYTSFFHFISTMIKKRVQIRERILTKSI